jgi:type IV pilus assembly protein PilM
MLTGKVISLDIGNRNMHLVQGRAKGNVAEIEICAQARTPDGSVRDGQIIDLPALSKALRELVRSSKASADRAIVVVKSTSIINREITIPVVKPEDLRQAVIFEMEQYVPNIGNDYAMEFVIADRMTAGGGDQYKLRVNAVPRPMVAIYSDLLKEAGLKPVVMDTAANALSKMVTRNRKLAANTNGLTSEATGADSPWTWSKAAFIDMGYEGTEINIFNEDKLVFSRLLQIGSRSMDAELLTALQVDPTALEARKTAADIEQTSGGGEEEDLNSVVRAHLQRWAGEIQTILQFYAGRAGDSRPEVFYLHGGNPAIGSLCPFFASVLGAPVFRIESLPVLHRTAARRSESYDIGPFVNTASALFRNE